MARNRVHTAEFVLCKPVIKLYTLAIFFLVQETFFPYVVINFEFEIHTYCMFLIMALGQRPTFLRGA